MIIDSSAVIAILRAEPEALEFARSIRFAPVRMIAAPTYLETCMVLVHRKGEDAQRELDNLIDRTAILIVPFTATAAKTAVAAFLKYGKGHHRAGLNFGDCISYALSKTELMPLLFKGNDFRLTDVQAAS